MPIFIKKPGFVAKEPPKALTPQPPSTTQPPSQKPPQEAKKGVITIKKTPTPPPPASNVLADVGLSPKPATLVKPAPPLEADALTFPVGTHVRISHGYGDWYPDFQEGDTGKITRFFKAMGLRDVRPDQDVYEVHLDHPRVKGKPLIFIPRNRITEV